MFYIFIAVICSLYFLDHRKLEKEMEELSRKYLSILDENKTLKIGRVARTIDCDMAGKKTYWLSDTEMQRYEKFVEFYYQDIGKLCKDNIILAPDEKEDIIIECVIKGLNNKQIYSELCKQSYKNIPDGSNFVEN